jgi:hypothetical protein
LGEKRYRQNEFGQLLKDIYYGLKDELQSVMGGYKAMCKKAPLMGNRQVEEYIAGVYGVVGVEYFQMEHMYNYSRMWMTVVDKNRDVGDGIIMPKSFMNWWLTGLNNCTGSLLDFYLMNSKFSHQL